MLEVGRDLNFCEKPLDAEDCGQLGAQHLEGDIALVPHVASEIHRRHAAAADLAVEIVPAREGRIESSEKVHLVLHKRRLCEHGSESPSKRI